MFSNGSGSSISLETVTPSLVTVGPPNDLARITLRPVGPSVVPTARARVSTPSSIFRRGGAERGPDGAGQGVDALEHLPAGGVGEEQLLRHGRWVLILWGVGPPSSGGP